MRLLPKWVLTNRQPGFYDIESGSAIEQTAKVYKAMEELIDEHNQFIEDMNNAIKQLQDSSELNYESFKENITKIMHDYIQSIDMKINKQDRKINDAILFMKDNISDSVSTLINEMKESGELDSAILETLENLTNTTLSYNLENEQLEIMNPVQPAVTYNELREELNVINIPTETI